MGQDLKGGGLLPPVVYRNGTTSFHGCGKMISQLACLGIVGVSVSLLA